MKTEIFTFKVEPELKEAFMMSANLHHQTSSQVLRELMRQFISNTNTTFNDSTIRALMESEQNKNLHTAKNIDDFCRQVGI